MCRIIAEISYCVLDLTLLHYIGKNLRDEVRIDCSHFLLVQRCTGTSGHMVPVVIQF